MRLDFNLSLLSHKGEELGQKLSEILADLISTEVKGPARKLWSWTLTLAHEGVLEIDAVDHKMLSELVDGTERLAVLVKGQILSVLDAAKDAAKAVEAAV